MILQSVSQVVSVQVQVLAENINVNMIYSRHNSIFNLLWSLFTKSDFSTVSSLRTMLSLPQE